MVVYIINFSGIMTNFFVELFTKILFYPDQSPKR